MLDLVDLIPNTVLILIFLLEVLDEAVVFFLNLGDGLRRVDQVRNEIRLDLVCLGLVEGDIFKLLIIVGATLFLLSVNFTNNGIDLLVKFVSKLLIVSLLPHFGVA